MKTQITIFTALALIVIIGTYSIFTINQFEYTDDVNTIQNYYTPSQMADSIPYLDDVLIGSYSTMTTTDIRDVKGRINASVHGIVTSIGYIEYWNDPTPGDEIPDYEELFGKDVKIPIHIKVIKAKKSDHEKGDVVTVKILGKLKDNILYIDDSAPQFEIGEEVIVHIGEDPNDIIEKDFQFVELGKYGKYKIENGKAFNEKYPKGKSIQDAFKDAK